MVGIIKNITADNSPIKEKHPVHDILGANLYNEAKTIVQDNIDTSDNVPKNHNLSEHLIG